jgi:general L-amino acid transport system permease protein
MDTLTKTIDVDHIRPPVTSVGVIGWIRANLFNSVFNSILTLVTLFLLGKVVPPLVRWAFIDSVWVSSSQACTSVFSFSDFTLMTCNGAL